LPRSDPKASPFFLHRVFNFLFAIESSAVLVIIFSNTVTLVLLLHLRFLISKENPFVFSDNLKDLQRFLRRDDPQKRDVFKQICKWNTVTRDLIPIIESYQNDRNLVITAGKFSNLSLFC
jgi:Timeless protein